MYEAKKLIFRANFAAMNNQYEPGEAIALHISKKKLKA